MHHCVSQRDLGAAWGLLDLNIWGISLAWEEKSEPHLLVRLQLHGLVGQ